MSIGCKLIILDKRARPPQRIEAEITGLDPDGTTGTGMRTYKVSFKDAKPVEYKDEKINEWGTSVIDIP